MTITFKLQLYCKKCDHGMFIDIKANSSSDVKDMTTNCTHCKNKILVSTFMFDDLKSTKLLHYESIKNRFNSANLSDEEFWNILEM